MKRLSYILLLFVLLINFIPLEVLAVNTCTRSKTNLHVRDELVRDDNLDDILSTPCVDDMDKVYDFADLLTEDEEKDLYQKVINYIDTTNYDLALVTTYDNPKNNAQEYADDFFDYNYFGKNETYDGVVILIDMATRELYVSTSGYAIKMYDDVKINNILDSGYYYITEERYYDTFNNMIASLTNNYNEEFPESNHDLIIDEFGNAHYIKYIPYHLVIILASVITLIVGLVLYFMSRLKIKQADTISYLKSHELNDKQDNFINTVVTHTIRSSSSSSGSSRSGGGSSFHTSSSGRSHGGGGRHF